MNTHQYTIRSIPPQLDKRLRAKAERSGKSLNAIIIETLTRAEGLTEPSQQYHDLDWFIGSDIADKVAFDEAQVWLESLPKDQN